MPRLSLFALLLLFAACDEIQQVSRSGFGAYEASMAALTGGYAVAWYDDRDGNAEIYFRLLDSQGRPRSPEYRLTHDSELSYEADIVAAGNDLAVAWYERLPDGNLRAKLGLWTQSAEPRWTQTIAAAGKSRNSRNILVRSHGSELFSAWIEDDGGEEAEVWGGWWNLQGKPVTLPRRLAPASRTTWNLNAIIDESGSAWIVFDAKAGTQSNELFLLRVDKNSSGITRLTSDDGFASKYPDLAFGAGSAALTWFDERDGNQEVYLFVASASDLQEGLEGKARRITETTGESMGAYVASNGDHFGLAWCDNSAGQHEIYFQPFEFDGQPRGEARRLTHTRTDSLIPSIKPAADTFALVWNEYASKGPGHSGGRSEIVFSLAR